MAFSEKSSKSCTVFLLGAEVALKARCIAQRQRVKLLEVAKPYTLPNMAHTRKPRPDFDLGVQLKLLKVVYIVPSWRGGRAGGALHLPAPVCKVARVPLPSGDGKNHGVKDLYLEAKVRSWP